MTADLETAVRSMLRERANDIDTLPADFAELASLDVLDLDARRHFDRRSHRSAWLIAAAIAAVLAVVGTAAAIRSNDNNHPAPPVNRHSTPVTTPTPTPTSVPTGHAKRTVSLDFFGMKQLTGFAEHVRGSEPDYRWMAVRGRTDSGIPVGCNGCEMASDYIYVFDKGRFTRASSVRSWSTVDVGGTSGYLGTMPSYPDGRQQLPTVAWEFRAGEWALVQGVTTVGSTRDALTTIAAAVEPTRAVPFELPFRFDYVPALPITSISDDRPEGGEFGMELGSFDGVSLHITLSNTKTLAGAKPHQVGGLPGYIKTNEAAALYAGGVAGFALDGVAGTMVGQPQAQVDAQTRALLTRIVNGVHWTNGTGRAPYLAADKAIP